MFLINKTRRCFLFYSSILIESMVLLLNLDVFYLAAGKTRRGPTRQYLLVWRARFVGGGIMCEFYLYDFDLHNFGSRTKQTNNHARLWHIGAPQIVSNTAKTDEIHLKPLGQTVMMLLNFKSLSSEHRLGLL